MVLAGYQLGQNTVFYVRNRDKSVGLCICPSDRVQQLNFDDFNTESMIQVKFTSDSSFIEFGEGLTMLSSFSGSRYEYRETGDERSHDHDHAVRSAA